MICIIVEFMVNALTDIVPQGASDEENHLSLEVADEALGSGRPAGCAASILDRSAILAKDAAARRELSAALKPESDRQTYGSATRKLVSIFQQERRLFGPTGAPRDEVDEPTANALNALLKELGVLDQPAEPTLLGYYVEGKVASRISASVGGLRVEIVDKGLATM